MCVGGCGYSLTHGVSCKWEASRTLSTQDHLAHLQEWMCTVFGGDIDFMAEDLWLSMISSRSSWTSIDDTLGLTWVTIFIPLILPWTLQRGERKRRRKLKHRESTYKCYMDDLKYVSWQPYKLSSSSSRNIILLFVIFMRVIFPPQSWSCPAKWLSWRPSSDKLQSSSPLQHHHMAPGA